jgi:hypothetical protein
MVMAVAVGCLLAVMTGVVPAAENSVYMSPFPFPLYSEQEMLQALHDQEEWNLQFVVEQIACLGPRYRWMLEEALQSSFDPARSAAVRALGSFGDDASVALVRSVLSDTTQSRRVVVAAADALAAARDWGSIPALEARMRGAENDFVKKSIGAAIDQIRCPGCFVPAMAVADSFVQFRFLLDNIEAVEYAESPSGPVVIFEPSEFRDVCVLLQTWVEPSPPSEELESLLVIRLDDGREAKIRRTGTLFCYHEPNRSGTIFWRRFTVESGALARLLDDRLAAMQRESSN